MAEEYMKTILALIITLFLSFLLQLIAKVPKDIEEEFNKAIITRDKSIAMEGL